MKVKTKKTILQLLTVMLCAVLSLGIAFTQFSETTAVAKSSASFSGKLVDVTGKVSSDNLHVENFNKEIVSENDFDGEEVRSVIVSFEGQSAMDAYNNSDLDIPFNEYLSTAEARAVIAEQEKVHNSFLSRLTANGIEYEFRYSYTTLTNGVAIKIKRKYYDALAGFRNVSGVTYSETYAVPQAAVSNNANVYKTGIYNTEGVDYDGSGMTVAILDTGLDYTHPAFTTMPQTTGMTEEFVSSKLAVTEAAKRTEGLKTNQVYYNDKVPFAYDYSDDDTDVYPSFSNHGTHVAGIVAGVDENKKVSFDSDETFVGVAPEAQLVICKVFTDDLDSEMIGGADTVDILAALTDCVTLGVDVINMSLGASCGFSDEGDKEDGGFVIEEVYNSINAVGISLVVAASNDYSSGFGGANGTNLASNPDSGTVGSPASYDSSLTVASINGNEAAYMVANQTSVDDESNVAFITEASDVNGNELDFINELYEKFPDKVDENGRITLNYVVVGGVGKNSDYTSSVKRVLNEGDTIALIKRGDNTFAEKVQNAMDNGAAAVIIYNNVSGTIRMSLGEVDNPVPTCSISMDAGKVLIDTATRNRGTVTICRDYTAGPFMSEFSSWGPTPDLKLKPEITAHGGEIISAVPGGGYEALSGTSMASPNMAGAVALLRQHVEQTFGFSGIELSDRVNHLLMSTATMALNDVGNPYSPRKQGAGLASIVNAVETEAYITVKDENGNVSDKTKIELGDDDDRVGEYDLVFTINNITNKSIAYTPDVKVMTETLATDLKTVAEKAYMLDDSIITITGSAYNATTNIVTVAANESAEITVNIKLGEDGLKYLEDSFENGMYVEGYVRMMPANDDTSVEIGLPYLGFYGDWADAPLFDWSVFEVAEDEADGSIEEEDKRKASAAATDVYGLYWDDKYILPLGTYIYAMDEEQTEIYPSTDKAALSYFDMEGRRNIYELYMVYAGLLRGAKELSVEIINKATGDLVYTEVHTNVRKSYAAGGGNYGSSIILELSPMEWGLSSNTTYVLNMSGKLDCEGGDVPDRNSFSFEFTVDNESPVIRDYRIRFEPYTENKETKYRIWLDLDVYDNQYASAILPCYITEIKGEDTLTLLTEYAIPTYSEKATEKTVSFEITDYYDEYVKTGEFYVSIQDYAMNETIYNIQLADGLTYPENLTFTTDNSLKLSSETTEEYNVYDITLAKNQAYKVLMEALPDSSVAQSLSWNVSNENVRVKDNEIFAVENGSSEITLVDIEEKIYAKINVTIEGEPLAEPLAERISFLPALSATRDLVNLTQTDVIELNPNQTVQFKVEADPWYVDLEYEWSTNNTNILDVGEDGTITTKTKGKAKLTAKAKGYDRLQKTITIVVGDIYEIRSYTLYEYYGGPEVVIPEDKNIFYIDPECFQNNKEITKVILPTTLMQINEYAFMNCTNLKEVHIPAECTIVDKYAFSGCTSLEKVVFGKYTDEFSGETSTGAVTLSHSAFSGCSSLTTIENSKRITTVGRYTFSGCLSLTSIDLTELRVAGNYAFNGCRKLKTIITSENTPISDNMFNGCTAIESFEIKTDRLGNGAFFNCTSLSEVTFTTSELHQFGSNAFYNTAIEEFTLPAGNYQIGDNAFSNCKKLKTFNITENANVTFDSKTPFNNCTELTTITCANNAYKLVDGILYNAEETAIILAPYKLSGEITIADNVTEIGANVFANRILTGGTINLNNVSVIGAYAFANSNIKTIDLANVEQLGDGVFNNCDSLETINNTENVVYIGEYAFYDCDALTEIEFNNVEEVGERAFENSTIKRLKAEKLEVIGDYAFANTALTGKLTLSSVRSIGEYAFYNSTSIKEVVLGGVTEMGDYAFYTKKPSTVSNSSLEKVAFGEGTTVVGNFAFMCEFSDDDRRSPYPKLETVILPDTVKTIGERAFYIARISSINLTGVEEIGDYAFYYADRLANVDLSNVKNIGTAAFYNTSISTADLTSIKEVGYIAFTNSKLTSLTIGDDVEKIGSEAFTYTQLTTVTIPNQVEMQYTEEWWAENISGQLELYTGKQTYKYGDSIFAAIPTLKEINVKGEGELFSEDGVLYLEVEEGIVLIQYPAGKTDTEYAILPNTVKIATGAFNNTVNLRKVVLPYTLRTIGSFAFYNTEENNYVKEYVFEGVTAPALEASYNELAIEFVVDEETEEEVPTDVSGAWFYGLYYTNFAGSVFEAVDVTTQQITEEGKNFGLKITYPENGLGYSTPVWKAYFSTVEASEYAPENVTKQTIEAIAKVPSVEDIVTALNGKNETEKIEYINGVSVDYAQVARTLYNQILSDAQRAFVTEYNKLLDVEAKIREVKAELNVPAELASLTIVSRPTKIEYVSGESFDATGMVVKAIYDDLSEIIVTDYTIDKTTLVKPSEFDTVVEVTISYGGKSCIQKVNVLEGTPTDSSSDSSSSSTGTESSSSIQEPNNDGPSISLIIGIVCAGVAVAAVAVVVVMLILKKKNR